MSKNKITLSPDLVKKIFEEVLFQESEVRNDKPILKIKPKVGIGIQMNYGFHPKRLEAKREEIKQMLLQLPHKFMESSKSGGDSFLNACMTKEGTLWTGFHERMEQLMVMGNTLGLVEYSMPKKLWLGGIPTFFVKDK